MPVYDCVNLRMDFILVIIFLWGESRIACFM